MQGESSRVKAMKDLTLYTYMGDARATIVVENKVRDGPCPLQCCVLHWFTDTQSAVELKRLLIG